MWKSAHDEVVASQSNETGMPEYIGREVAHMTAYEILMVVLRVIGLLISLGSLVVALLNFLDNKRNKKQK